MKGLYGALPGGREALLRSGCYRPPDGGLDMRIAIGVVLLLLILAAFYIYSLNGTEGFRFFGEGASGAKPALPFWEAAASGLAMLLGLCFGVLYEQLKQKTGRTKFGEEI